MYMVPCVVKLMWLTYIGRRIPRVNFARDCDLGKDTGSEQFVLALYTLQKMECLAYYYSCASYLRTCNMSLGEIPSGARLNINILSYQYKDPNARDKTVSGPYYLQHGNHHAKGRRSLYSDRAPDFYISTIFIMATCIEPHPLPDLPKWS